MFGNTTKTNSGFYTYSVNVVTWDNITGTVSGNTMTTNMSTLAGGKRVYTESN
jgi:hypothetical protein